MNVYNASDFFLKNLARVKKDSNGWVCIWDLLPEHLMPVDVFISAKSFAKDVELSKSRIEKNMVFIEPRESLFQSYSFQDKYCYKHGLYELSWELNEGFVKYWRIPQEDNNFPEKEVFV